MKITTKLLLSLILIAVLSILITLNFSILSISRRYERAAREQTAIATQNAEAVFLENLSDLVRKALFLSELQEVIENVDRLDKLETALEFKDFFFTNTNIKIVAPSGEILLAHDNSSRTAIAAGSERQLPLLQPERDPLLREAGVFRIGDQLCLAAISPIVAVDTFALKGFVLLEIPFNLELADQIKEKSRAEIMLYAGERPLVSTLYDRDGEMVFALASRHDRPMRLVAAGNRFLVSSFAVEDYAKQRVGEIRVGVDIEAVLAARQVSISGLLYLSLLIGLIVIVTSFLLGRRLTAPITTLARGVEAIAGGDYDVRVPQRSRDEIGDLAAVFNRMSQSLKTQRDEIRELQQFFAKIVEHSPSAIVIANGSGEVLAMNPAAEKLLETSLAQFQDQPLFAAVPALASLQEDFLRVLLSGSPCFRDHFSLVQERQAEKIVRLTLYQIPLPAMPAAVLQLEDISEKFALEEKLLHAQKLGTLGELLSRFAHEFNNLMTSLLGHLSLLKKEAGPGLPLSRRVQLIEEVAQRAHNLGRDVLDFSRRERPGKEPTDVAEAVRTVLNLLGKTVLKRVQVETRFMAGPLTVLIEKERFLLALFNLLINARDAIVSSGVECGQIHIQVDRVFVPRTENHFVRIRIQDNGLGIDPAILPRIFEPYFTTKGAKGTGLGLSTVKEVVEVGGGWIEIQDGQGGGTAFTLFLPEHAGQSDDLRG